MDKKEVLAQLRRAKSAHILWRSYAQALVSGLAVEEEHLPVMHTDCKFGQWYYGSGQQLSSLASFEAIGMPHDILHKVYRSIFELLFGEDKRTSLQKLFGSKAKLEQKRHDEADVLMQNLLQVSGTLLDVIDLLEDEIEHISEEEFSTM